MGTVTLLIDATQTAVKGAVAEHSSKTMTQSKDCSLLSKLLFRLGMKGLGEQKSITCTVLPESAYACTPCVQNWLSCARSLCLCMQKGTSGGGSISLVQLSAPHAEAEVEPFEHGTWPFFSKPE